MTGIFSRQYFLDFRVQGTRARDFPKLREYEGGGGGTSIEVLIIECLSDGTTVRTNDFCYSAKVL